jgi:hypothetical protein
VAAGSVSFEVSQKDIDRIRKKLEKASGKPLYQRMQRAALAAGDLIKPRIQAETPIGPTKNLRRYTRSRLARKRIGNTYGPSLAVLVGPTSPHRHLVIRGHRIVTPGGRYLGRSTRANPYVDRAARGFERKAADLVRKEWAAALR